MFLYAYSNSPIYKLINLPDSHLVCTIRCRFLFEDFEDTPCKFRLNQPPI
jgi:hypothetical protein